MPDETSTKASVGKCVGTKIDEYVASGISLVTAMQRAEEDCVGSRQPHSIPTNKALDDACYKTALDKHLKDGMIARDAENAARSECQDNSAASNGKAFTDAPNWLGGEKRDIPQSERDKMPATEFAGPHQSFPIAKPEDIAAAAHLIGKADNPEAVKARIIAIAKKHGWTSSLPASWQTKSWRDKVDSRLKDWGLLPSEADLQTSFKVSGNHWLATWSNNFKDRDGEIFTEKAIDDYVRRVDMGVVPAPELWVWHTPGTAVGQADWVGREGHFLVAGGQFYGGEAAQVAKAYYARSAKDTSISHGFQFAQKDFDGTHYHSFNTFEISLLPRGAEANLFTSLEGVKEMALTDTKKKYLFDAFGKEQAGRILASLDEKGKALEELGVEYKDFAGSGSELSADAKAVANVEQSLKEFIPDLTEGNAEAVKAALEAVKLVKQYRADYDAELANMKASVAHLTEQMGLRPRSVQREEVKENILTGDKSAQIAAALAEQNKQFDPFWQQVVKQPLNGGNNGR